MLVCLAACLRVRLFVCVARLFDCLFVCLLDWLSFPCSCVCLLGCLFACLVVCLFACLIACVFVCVVVSLFACVIA